MEQPNNAPNWATHWCPPFNDGGNPLGFWLGDMDKPFPSFQGLTWPTHYGVRKLSGRAGLIFRGAIPLQPEVLLND